VADILEPRYYKQPYIENYLKEIKAYLFKTISSPETQIAPILSEVTQHIETAMDQVRVNGQASVPFEFESQKLRSNNYNEMIENIQIDLAVLYDNLSSFVTILTQTVIMMDRVISKMISKVDDQTSRIQSLEALSNLHVEFDEVIHNSFTSDDNTYPIRDSSTINKDTAGVITLNTVNVDDIVKDELGYDLYLKPVTRGALTVINNETLAAESFVNTMDMDIISDSPAGIEYAIIIVLPAAKWINNISFGQFSSHALTIEGIFYVSDINTSSDSTNWTEINTRTDVFNYRNFNFNFEQVDARSIMIKVKQEKYKIKKIAADMASRLFFSGETRSFSDVLHEIGKNSTQNTSGFNQVVPTIVRESIDKKIKVLIQNAIDTLNLDLNSEDGNKGDLTSTYWYNIGMFDLRIYNNRYQDDNIYRSQTFGGRGDITAVTLVKNDNVPDGTLANYYLEVGGDVHRFDSNDEWMTDIITINDTTVKTYNTDLFLDSAINIEVTRNGSIVGGANYSIRKPYATSQMAYGITFDNSYTLGLGDFVTIKYKVASVNDLGNPYSPNTLNIVDIGGKPNLRNQLEDGNLQRMIIETQNGDFVSYSITNDEAHPFLIPSSASGDIPEFGYGIKSKKSMNDSIFPPYVDLVAPYLYGISGEYVTPPQRAIYYGIINENISGGGGTSFNTAYDYIPGSLHVYMSGRPLITSEYDTDTSYPGNDKNAFTTPLHSGIDGIMKTSYIPLSGDVGAQQSNIAEQNRTELFFGTDEDNVITLEFGIYIDPRIIGDTSTVPPIWREGDGIFVLEYNNDVVYEPVIITIRGKRARNLTDYVGNTKPEFTEFSPARRNYEYYVEANRVYFNTNIDLEITVRYYVLPDILASVIKLYRTDRSIDTATPAIYDYSNFIDKA